MMQFEDQSSPVSTISSTNSLLSKTFFRMFLGILATAFAAGYTFYSGMLESLMVNNSFVGIFLAEIIVALVFSFAFRKLSPAIVTGLFFAYSILTGVTLSTLFVMFELNSIVYALAGSAAIFGILAYIGKNTTKDLSSFGTILMVTLSIGLIVTIVNLFIGNPTIDIVLDWVILFIFAGFTIYDINKIVNLQNSGIIEDEKLYIYGAMELYLDFINIFLRLLYLFGNRKD